jgi:pyruvate kinase
LNIFANSYYDYKSGEIFKNIVYYSEFQHIINMKRKTKIIATISDLNCEVSFISALYEAGMDVVRLNTAHQSPEDTLRIIQNVRKVSDKIALLLDTKGPEIRITKSESDIIVAHGDTIKMSGSASAISSQEMVFVNYDKFIFELKVKDKILIDDGQLELEVTELKKDHILCKALNKGVIKGKKSVNVPGVSFNLPSVTQKDKEYIEFAAKHKLDFIAHSFVRNKEDVLEVQKILDHFKSDIKIIAKIENQEGVKNIEEILDQVYGIMVARGDLAIEIPYEKIPGIQKMIVNKCIQHRKPVIIATQMLHSMIHEPRPTRAEVSDIANAIYSKTDAIMLSGETASGKYPLEAVETMAKVAKEVELSRNDMHDIPSVVLSTNISAYLSRSAVEASIKLDAAAIIADTSTGRTIRNMAGFRGRKPIYAMCYDKKTARALSLSFGVFPSYFEPQDSAEMFIEQALKKLLKKKELKESDIIVVLGGNFGRHHGASHIEISSVANLSHKVEKLQGKPVDH